MKVTIQQINKWYVVDIGDNRIHMLNINSLRMHLKKWNFDANQRIAILQTLERGAAIQIQMPEAV